MVKAPISEAYSIRMVVVADEDGYRETVLLVKVIDRDFNNNIKQG